MSTPTSTVKPVFSPYERLANVKLYLLAAVFGATAEQIAQGVDVIDLIVGNPDLRPPDEAIRGWRRPCTALWLTHQYAPFASPPEFKQAVMGGCRSRLGVAAEPQAEAIVLAGSKEGIMVNSPGNPTETAAARLVKASVRY